MSRSVPSRRLSGINPSTANRPNRYIFRTEKCAQRPVNGNVAWPVTGLLSILCKSFLLLKSRRISSFTSYCPALRRSCIHGSEGVNVSLKVQSCVKTGPLDSVLLSALLGATDTGEGSRRPGGSKCVPSPMWFRICLHQGPRTQRAWHMIRAAA